MRHFLSCLQGDDEVRIPQAKGGNKDSYYSQGPLGPLVSSSPFSFSSIFPTNPSMRFDRLLPALLSFFAAASAQTLSGLTFDSGDEVSLIWAFDGQTTGRYDFYLCAGDESTGVYVSRVQSMHCTTQFREYRANLYRNL
jgi:hypothetical protein